MTEHADSTWTAKHPVFASGLVGLGLTLVGQILWLSLDHYACTHQGASSVVALTVIGFATGLGFGLGAFGTTVAMKEFHAHWRRRFLVGIAVGFLTFVVVGVSIVFVLILTGPPFRWG